MEVEIKWRPDGSRYVVAFLGDCASRVADFEGKPERLPGLAKECGFDMTKPWTYQPAGAMKRGWELMQDITYPEQDASVASNIMNVTSLIARS